MSAFKRFTRYDPNLIRDQGTNSSNYYGFYDTKSSSNKQPLNNLVEETKNENYNELGLFNFKGLNVYNYEGGPNDNSYEKLFGFDSLCLNKFEQEEKGSHVYRE